MKLHKVTTPDFDVTVKLRNNHLVAFRESFGWGIKEFAEKCGMSYYTYWALESMVGSPVASKGGWKASALKIAKFMNTDPEAIWPNVILKVRNPKVNLKVCSEQISAAFPQLFNENLLPPHPEEYIAKQDLEDLVRTAVMALEAEERQAVVLLYGLDGEGERTPEATAEAMYTTPSEVLKIVKSAFKKLRHHDTSKDLLPALMGPEYWKKAKMNRAEVESREKREFESLQQRILRVLKRVGGWFSLDDVLEEFEPGTISKKRTYEILEGCTRDGRLIKNIYRFDKTVYRFKTT
jgi:transcriptional regulator with XRE-family HTH domain